jgi:hypothetical protein
MATVTVVLGLCGSGKTTLVKQLVGVATFDEGVAPGWPQHDAFRDALAAGRDCAIVEAAYCFAPAREAFVEEILQSHPDTTFNWLCSKTTSLPQTRAAAWTRHARPNKFRPTSSKIHESPPLYTYPAGSIVLAIVGASASVAS